MESSRTLQDWASISTIAQAFIVLISLGYIAWQIRQNVFLAKASNTNALTEQVSAFNTLLFQDGKLAELWYGYGANYDYMTVQERLQYREMLLQWMLLHENIYYQWVKGLLDDTIYNSWKHDLAFTVQWHNVDVFLGEIDQLFKGVFAEHIHKMKKITVEKGHIEKLILDPVKTKKPVKRESDE